MESPPTYSTHSEAPVLSDDSGLLLTSGSFSSDSASGSHQITSELQESDYDDHSLSCESTETSERMCTDNFNTVKKGPGKVIQTTIEPPPEFQDNPTRRNDASLVAVKPVVESPITQPTKPAITVQAIALDIPMSKKNQSLNIERNKPETLYERKCLNHRFSPRLLHLSPCRSNRPASRNSLTSRLSSSHNSLIIQLQADDSSFITQAISHDTLSTKTSDIPDMYNVPFDSDIYAVPIDTVKPNQNTTRHKGKKSQRSNKKRGKTVLQSLSLNVTQDRSNMVQKEVNTSSHNKEGKMKRHSLPGTSVRQTVNESDTDSLHLTLREMRKYLHTLYSSSSDSESKTNGSVQNYKDTFHKRDTKEINSRLIVSENPDDNKINESNNNHKKCNKYALSTNQKSKKCKDNNHANTASKECMDSAKAKKNQSQSKTKSTPVRILSVNLKQSFCNLFRWRRQQSVDSGDVEEVAADGSPAPAVVRRALPPLPQSPQSSKRQGNEAEAIIDFATSIQRVKDYGWYWGPLPVEAAESLLSNEPDGSFIVRDSSDDHYIFTLTFKLNGLRHVRIEHNQGNFCFGGCTMFKAPSIVEFIDKAVETSRNGRYLFFLHLRPVLGPVRVQLLYPVSRFKRVQSLQHLCRFVILKNVRRDLVNNLPLPRRLLDYLSATHYYSEMLADI